MPCFGMKKSNLKKPDPETSSGRQHGWHPQTQPAPSFGVWG